MAEGSTETKIPNLFEEVFDEMDFHGNKLGLMSDAHGLSRIGSFSDLSIESSNLSKDEVIKELEDLEYYEKVREPV